MRALTTLTVALVLLLGTFAAREAWAERATAEEMDRVCENWLAYIVHEKGAWAGEVRPSIAEVEDIVEDGILLARCYSIAPWGYVLVPVLKEMPPVKAYSERNRGNVDDAFALPYLLRQALCRRVDLFVETYGSLDASPPVTGDVPILRARREQWDRLLASREEFDAGLKAGAFPPLEKDAPLLTTSSHQSKP